MTPLEITLAVWAVGAALCLITLGVQAVGSPKGLPRIELTGILIMLILAPVMGLVSIGILIGYATRGRR